MSGPVSHLLADAALVVALLAYGELLVRLRRAEPADPWWFGYARDGANLAASLMLWGAYLMFGLPPSVALLAGLWTALVTYLLDWTLFRALKLPAPRVLLAVPLLAWALFVALATGRVVSLFAHLLALGRPG
jgi:hypothetical protein